jgi:hypothetical protein
VDNFHSLKHNNFTSLQKKTAQKFAVIVSLARARMVQNFNDFQERLFKILKVKVFHARKRTVFRRLHLQAAKRLFFCPSVAEVFALLISATGKLVAGSRLSLSVCESVRPFVVGVRYFRVCP